MRKLMLVSVASLLTVFSASACEEGIPEKYRVHPDEMRANLKNAVLIGIVAEGADANQLPARTLLPGVRKNGKPLCEDLTVEELTDRDALGSYVNDCENPDPLSYCQDIHPDKLATGRVECQQRPWEAGELMAVDHNGEAFSVLPSLPSWNQVTRVQQSEGNLLVTLRYPMKLLLTDQTVDYCHVLYYTIDTTSDSVLPYCFEYEYDVPFCFGPTQKDGAWASAPHLPSWYVNADGGEVEYTERLEHLEGGPVVCASPPKGSVSGYTKPMSTVHVTPHALFESYAAGAFPSEEVATRIVTGNEEAHYPMGIDLFTLNGMISAGTYYTFDASHVSITGSLSAEPIHWADARGNYQTFESGSRILYGFQWPGTSYNGSAMSGDSTAIRLDVFDTETLEDGSMVIDVSPHPRSADLEHGKWWHLEVSLGDYLFLLEDNFGESIFFRVDTRSDHPIIEEIYRRGDVVQDTGQGLLMIMNGWAVHAVTEVPFLAYLYKPDGTMAEVNADMLGFNPQTLEVEDDQIVVSGMDGLTPRRFIIHPLATTEGELLVETPTETIPVKTLIPLQ